MKPRRRRSPMWGYIKLAVWVVGILLVLALCAALVTLLFKELIPLWCVACR
jgi:hypothetical protein